MRALTAALDVLDRIERAIVSVALLMMAGIMIIVSLDVTMRYVFNRPLWWAYDLIGVYLMCGLFFLLLSRTYWMQAHIAVDLLQRRLSSQSRRLGEMLTSLACAVAFALLTYATVIAASAAYVDGDTTASGNWQIWPALAMAPLGLNCFVVARYSGRPVQEVFQGSMPHFIAHLFVIALLTAFPEIVLWPPSLMR